MKKIRNIIRFCFRFRRRNIYFFPLVFLSGLLFLPVFLQGQDKAYAQSIVDTLTKPACGGRGYDGSDKKAAGFIIRELQSAGISPLLKSGSYLQPFPISINQITGSIELALDGDTLSPGRDYLMLVDSPPAEGSFETVKMEADTNNILIWNHKPSFYRQKFIVTSLSPRTVRQQLPFPVKGIIYLKDRNFYWHISDGLSRDSIVEIYLRDTLYHPGVRNVSMRLNTQFKENYITQNVMGLVKGRKYPDRYILLTAHYDHLGRMGKRTFFPGGHDNASGTAMVLDMAKYFSRHLPDKTVVFVFFSGEEAGLLGSSYFVNHFPVHPGKIDFVINLDLMGAGSKGITVVNAKKQKEAFDILLQLNEKDSLIYQVKARDNAPNSDHYPFTVKGVPAVFIYTLGEESQAYHSPDDNSGNVHFTGYDDLFRLIIKWIQQL